jgi:hypothetical protein
VCKDSVAFYSPGRAAFKILSASFFISLTFSVLAFTNLSSSSTFFLTFDASPL